MTVITYSYTVTIYFDWLKYTYLTPAQERQLVEFKGKLKRNCCLPHWGGWKPERILGPVFFNDLEVLKENQRWQNCILFWLPLVTFLLALFFGVFAGSSFIFDSHPLSVKNSPRPEEDRIAALSIAIAGPVVFGSMLLLMLCLKPKLQARTQKWIDLIERFAKENEETKRWLRMQGELGPTEWDWIFYNDGENLNKWHLDFWEKVCEQKGGAGVDKRIREILWKRRYNDTDWKYFDESDSEKDGESEAETETEVD